MATITNAITEDVQAIDANSFLVWYFYELDDGTKHRVGPVLCATGTDIDAMKTAKGVGLLAKLASDEVTNVLGLDNGG